MATGELADHQGRIHRVDGDCRVQVAAVTGWGDLPIRSAVAAAKVSASHL